MKVEELNLFAFAVAPSLHSVAGPAAPRVTQTIEVKQVTLSDLEDGDED